MRNPDRLDFFYDRLKAMHKKHFPDWRFGQFMSNFFGWMGSTVTFYYEEDEILTKLAEYCNKYGAKDEEEKVYSE